MPEALNSNKKPLLEIASGWKWLVAAWAPVQVAYEAASKAHLIKTDLLHLLFYISWVTGGFLVIWMVLAFVLISLFAIVFGLIFRAFDDVRDIYKGLGPYICYFLAGTATLGFAIAAMVHKDDLILLSSVDYDSVRTWVFAGLGAAGLSWVYGSVFNQVRSALTTD